MKNYKYILLGIGSQDPPLIRFIYIQTIHTILKEKKAKSDITMK